MATGRLLGERGDLAGVFVPIGCRREKWRLGRGRDGRTVLVAVVPGGGGVAGFTQVLCRFDRPIGAGGGRAEGGGDVVG